MHTTVILSKRGEDEAHSSSPEIMYGYYLPNKSLIRAIGKLSISIKLLLLAINRLQPCSSLIQSTALYVPDSHQTLFSIIQL